MMLISPSKVRKFIKEQIKAKRQGWNATQISSSSIQNINGKVMAMIIDAVIHHPTKGKTFDFEL